MRRNHAKILMAALGIAGLAGGASGQSSNATPTCSDVLDIDVHGEHVVADYVMGVGHQDFDWSPSGGVVGERVSANGGAATPGGPGPGYHFEEGIAPGASFCTDSNSPGIPHD